MLLGMRAQRRLSLHNNKGFIGKSYHFIGQSINTYMMQNDIEAGCKEMTKNVNFAALFCVYVVLIAMLNRAVSLDYKYIGFVNIRL